MPPWEITGKVGEFDEDWRVTTLAGVLKGERLRAVESRNVYKLSVVLSPNQQHPSTE